MKGFELGLQKREGKRVQEAVFSCEHCNKKMEKKEKKKKKKKKGRENTAHVPPNGQNTCTFTINNLISFEYK